MESEARMKAVVDAKVRARLLPVLFVAALLCYIDRTNLSFAAIQMNKDLGFSNIVYGVGASIFFATYALFGIPSSLMVKRLGARIGLPLILILWGFASGAMAFVNGTFDFYFLRLLVGATEAGFFPAVIYYLTMWCSEEDMGLNYTAVMTSTAVSGIIGGPIAGIILENMDGVIGVRGWRWLFLAEALPTIILGGYMLYYLDGEPKEARFLDLEERTWLTARQRKQEESRDSRHAVNGLSEALRLRWLWVIIGIWLLYSCGYYGIIFWLPLLIHSLGIHSEIIIGFLSAIPYICSAFAMILVARSSDRTLERRLHLALPALFSSIGFFGAAAVHSFFGNQLIPLLTCLSAAAAGVWSMFGPFWGVPTAMLTGDTAAAGFALINSVGVVGGAVGPSIVGWTTDHTGTYDTSLVIFGLMMAVSGTLALLLRVNIGSNRAASNNIPSYAPLAAKNATIKYATESVSVSKGYEPLNASGVQIEANGNQDPSS